jgi:dTDP-4-dehydrorhamnose 3,5-epimerase
MPFTFRKLEFDGLVLVTPKIFDDARGLFFESYQRSIFSENGLPDTFRQDNVSRSTHAVLRGLHFQLPPYEQGKLVGVLQGRVWDVVVDMRRSSETFGRWTAVELDDRKREMLFVPPGFAHGFVVLSSEALFVYKCTKEYSKDHEGGIRWNDADLRIAWPISVPVVSEKDQKLPSFRNARHFDEGETRTNSPQHEQDERTSDGGEQKRS